DRLMRWLAGFTDHRTRTGRAKYGGAGRGGVTPEGGGRKKGGGGLWCGKLSCERRGKATGKKGGRGGGARGMTVRSLRLQGDGAMGRLVAETGDVQSEGSCGREATVG